MVKIMELADDASAPITCEFYHGDDARRSMVCFIKQKLGDYSTWEYPNIIEGMWESTKKKGTWLYQMGTSSYMACPVSGNVVNGITYGG